MTETTHEIVENTERVEALTVLPASATPILGRDAELSDLIDRTVEHQIVSVVGQGGIGKTRLVSEAARQLADLGLRVGFVELADVEDAAAVVDRIADALAVATVPGATRYDGIVHLLRGTPTVLVLDNFEQVIEAAPSVAAFVEESPDLVVVVTSRRALGLDGESILKVEPLSSAGPASPSTGSGALLPAVQLFLDRALSATPTPAELHAAHRIVDDVGGVPLAIELAAFRARTLGAAVVADLLTSDLCLDGLETTVGTSDRHLSLRGCLDWSHRSLDEPARELFRVTGAFAGTFDLDDLVRVSGRRAGVAAELATLLDHHLVDPVELDGQTRYTSSPPIRAYARELLASGPDVDEIVTRHAHRFAANAALIRDRAARGLVDRAIAAYLRQEPNIRIAILTLANQGDMVGSCRIALDVADIAVEVGREERVHEWFRDFVTSSDTATTPVPIEARIWAASAEITGRQPATADAPLRSLAETIDLAREAGDEAAILRGLDRLILTVVMHGDIDQARAAAAEGIVLAQRRDERRSQTEFLIWQGMLHQIVGELDAAYASGLNGLRRAREMGDSRLIIRAVLLLATLPPGPEAGMIPSLDSCLALARGCGSVLDELYVVMQLTARAGLDGRADVFTLALQGFELATRTRSQPGELVIVLALAAAAFRAGDDAEGIRLHAGIRPRWPLLQTMVPGGPLDRYQSLVESRRAADPEWFDHELSEAGAMPWAELVNDARRYARERGRPRAPGPLTARELDVLRELATGATNKDVAKALGMRPKTVMHHCAAIYRKLQVRNRSEAVAVGLRSELLGDLPV